MNDEDFFNKTIDTIEPEHFKDTAAKLIFQKIKQHHGKFGKAPSQNELDFEIRDSVSDEEEYENCEAFYTKIDGIETEFAIEKAEEYIKTRSIYNALLISLEIHDEEETNEYSKIPEILEEAINITFDRDFGIDYFNDIDKRLESYDHEAEKIPLKLSILNKITNGGFESKTLNIFMAPTGFGKSIMMADDCLHQAINGRNCIYFTFEMSDSRISKRLDANHLDIPINEMQKHSKNLRKRFEEQRSLSKGDIFLKEYPPGCITPSVLSSYIKEIQSSKKIKIDMIYVDYINLMASSQYTKSTGTYSVIKGVAEELIQVAKKHDLCVVSASQLTRDGQVNSAPNISMVSESAALPNTVDFMVSMFDNEELEAMSRCCGKQLKNRYGDINYYGTFMMGLERSKMRFYDVSEEESDKLTDNIKEEKEDKKSEEKSFSKKGSKLSLGDLT